MQIIVFYAFISFRQFLVISFMVKKSHLSRDVLLLWHINRKKHNLLYIWLIMLLATHQPRLPHIYISTGAIGHLFKPMPSNLGTRETNLFWIKNNYPERNFLEKL